MEERCATERESGQYTPVAGVASNGKRHATEGRERERVGNAPVVGAVSNEKERRATERRERAMHL